MFQVIDEAKEDLEVSIRNTLDNAQNRVTKSEHGVQNGQPEIYSKADIDQD